MKPAPAERLGGLTVWSEEYLRQRARETAKTALEQIIENGEWKYPHNYLEEQTIHWFSCLTSVLEFERQPGESLTSYVRRAMNA